MRFDQGFLLWALPLMALPILIHLINQNRHKTIHWAATMFLLEAKRMARGMARLKYLLLMAARMLAIAALIFAMSRPWVGGWLGALSGDDADVTIIVLDRSVSMEEQDAQSQVSKRETALRKLRELVESSERNAKLVLFDSVTRKPLEITSVEALEELPVAKESDTTADIPGMMLDVADYIAGNKLGRTDVWVCSDLRANDWSAADGRWESVRSAFRSREGVRFYLLTYGEVAEDNLSVSVSGVHRRDLPGGAELVMDIRVQRAKGVESPTRVNATVVYPSSDPNKPNREPVVLELSGDQALKTGYSVPGLDADAEAGWARVELPMDSNPRDNVFNIVYSDPPVQKSVVVSDDPQAAQLFRLATGTAADNSLVYEVEVLPSAAAKAIKWEETALIVWHAPLPIETTAAQLEDYIRSGRSVVFFPPDNPDGTKFLGCSWTEWKTAAEGESFQFAPWRNDSDLLADTRSGGSLEVGEVQCYRLCGLETEKSVTLWQTSDRDPILTRIPTDQGGAWFCSTLPTPVNSNLVSKGVTYYIMMQRALARGAAGLGAARIVEAGAEGDDTAGWEPLDVPSQKVAASQRAVSAGIYMEKDRWLALNRPPQEDTANVVADDSLDDMMAGLDYVRIDDTVDSEDSLLSEIWRAFLVTMVIALIAEALLCVPERTQAEIKAAAAS